MFMFKYNEFIDDLDVRGKQDFSEFGGNTDMSSITFVQVLPYRLCIYLLI